MEKCAILVRVWGKIRAFFVFDFLISSSLCYGMDADEIIVVVNTRMWKRSTD
jgi:hypothetical protein